MNTRLVIGPFNRVEGDLEVRLTLDNQQVSRAEVVSPLYRGFEQILLGRAPLDALTIAPRVCGICSVSQSIAAAAALRQAADITPPANGIHALNLLQAAENLADHLTHSFVFFLPDFAQDFYRSHRWHDFAVAAYKANQGRRSAAMIRLRARILHLIGQLAGKWPHSLAIQPGGTTSTADTGSKVRLLSILSDVRRGLEEQVFAAPLEQILALSTPDALTAYQAADAPESCDFRFFLHLCTALNLSGLGPCTAPPLSYGAYAAPDGTRLFPAGQGFPPTSVALFSLIEDLESSWMDGPPQPPWESHNRPNPHKENAYSWSKAPRLAGKPHQTGAWARQVIAGHPLLRAQGWSQGSSVASRVMARFLEMAALVPAMEQWARAIRPHQAFYTDAPLPSDAVGIGLTEAARGALGHWLAIRQNRLTQYQIIAPTTWNFSPRDQAGVPGPLEQALHGLALPADVTPSRALAVQHIVRSFDPCMACTVH